MHPPWRLSHTHPEGSRPCFACTQQALILGANIFSRFASASASLWPAADCFQEDARCAFESEWPSGCLAACARAHASSTIVISASNSKAKPQAPDTPEHQLDHSFFSGSLYP